MDAEMGRKQGRSGEKSNFAVVCSLLSQYIKEKGGVVADLGLGVPPPPLDAPKGESFPLVYLSLLQTVYVRNFSF